SSTPRSPQLAKRPAHCLAYGHARDVAGNHDSSPPTSTLPPVSAALRLRPTGSVIPAVPRTIGRPSGRQPRPGACEHGNRDIVDQQQIGSGNLGRDVMTSETDAAEATDQLCFCCQRLAEKYLKALMQEGGLPAPRTHALPWRVFRRAGNRLRLFAPIRRSVCSLGPLPPRTIY